MSVAWERFNNAASEGETCRVILSSQSEASDDETD
jgi:hypothetical protein